jgi:hypothetical protein
VHFYSTFGVLSVQTGMQWHKVGPADARRARAAPAPQTHLPKAASCFPNAPRPETPHALRRPVRDAPCPPVRRGFPCARAGQGRSPYGELRPGCPIAVKARSPSPPIKQAAAGHPRARHEPAAPAVRSPTARSTSCRPVLRHTLPRPPKSYPHRPLAFPGWRLARARAPAAAAAWCHRPPPLALLDPQLRYK